MLFREGAKGGGFPQEERGDIVTSTKDPGKCQKYQNNKSKTSTQDSKEQKIKTSKTEDPKKVPNPKVQSAPKKTIGIDAH